MLYRIFSHSMSNMSYLFHHTGCDACIYVNRMEWDLSDKNTAVFVASCDEDISKIINFLKNAPRRPSVLGLHNFPQFHLDI